MAVPEDSRPDEVVISVMLVETVPLLMRSLGVRAPLRVDSSRLGVFCEVLRRRWS